MSIVVSQAGPVCRLTLDCPPGNVIDLAVARELEGAVRECGSDPELKALVLQGSGKHFSFGASVPDHLPGKMEEFLPQFHHLFRALAQTRVPMVAAVRGQCLGGGFELAAFCHFLIAEPDTRFAVPEIQLGVFPPVACALFPWRFGGALSEDLILSGRSMDVGEAFAHGLVTKTCAAGELDEATDAFLEEALLSKSGSSLRIATEAARATLYSDFFQRLEELEQFYLQDLMETEDANEGIRAFLDKRQPTWSNR